MNARPGLADPVSVGELIPEVVGRGRVLAAISTGIVAILREHYGRGPMRAKTYAVDDLIMVVMRGSGYTPLERTIVAAGGADRVVAMRHDFQGLVAERYKQVIRDLTGCDVLAFLSQAHIEPDLTIEIFLIDKPIEFSEPADTAIAR
jgi:uncharacterized protein YbcI